MKPSLIAKKLRVTNVFINSTVTKFKKDAKDEMQGKQLHQLPLRKQRFLKSEDPLLLDIIKEYLEKNGIYKTRIQHLRDFIQQQLPLYTKAPAHATLQKILRNVFHQHFKRDDLACVRYRDTIYNNKRLWISRIIAQLMHDDVVIVSIDESNIRSDALRER